MDIKPLSKAREFKRKKMQRKNKQPSPDLGDLGRGQRMCLRKGVQESNCIGFLYLCKLDGGYANAYVGVDALYV